MKSQKIYSLIKGGGDCMKLKHLLEYIHAEQYIEIYLVNECVFSGYRKDCSEDNLLYLYVDKIWTSQHDMFGIEIR